jgi:phosphotriesterase-related protein
MKGRSAEINPDLRIDDADKSASELRGYYEVGGRAVVDAQPVGCGRDARFLENVSRVGGVHIIASTGFHKTQFYPAGHWIFSMAEGEIEQIFVDELADGMYVSCDSSAPLKKTGIRAGQIKTALDGELSALCKKLFSAAARAAKITDRALMIHVERGSNPLELAGFLDGFGVNPERVVFCHMDRATDDIAVHREICSRGSSLEYDTICRPKYHDDGREAEIIASMLDAGFEDSLLMSLDVTRARLASYGGAPGLCYIIDKFMPFLRDRGVSEGQIRKAFVDNPARVFSHETPFREV